MPETSAVAALLTPVLACVAAYIAWRQWVTANNKVKLDLFDKRYRIFAEIRTLLSGVMQNASLSLDQLLIFKSSVCDASFLFGSDVSLYIEDIYKHGVELTTASSQLRDPTDYLTTEERKDLAHTVRLEIEWFSDQFEILPRLFSRYLDLSKL